MKFHFAGRPRASGRSLVAIATFIVAMTAVSLAGPPASASRPMTVQPSQVQLTSPALTRATAFGHATAEDKNSPAMITAEDGIRNRNSGSCVNAPGGWGSVVLQLNCTNGWGIDAWDFHLLDSVNRIYNIKNHSNNLCLEIVGWSTADAGAAATFPCVAGWTQQQWILTSRGDGYFEVKNVNSGRCLDARTTFDWINIYQWACHGGGEQQWLLR